MEAYERVLGADKLGCHFVQARQTMATLGGPPPMMTHLSASSLQCFAHPQQLQMMMTTRRFSTRRCSTVTRPSHCLQSRRGALHLRSRRPSGRRQRPFWPGQARAVCARPVLQAWAMGRPLSWTWSLRTRLTAWQLHKVRTVLRMQALCPLMCVVPDSADEPREHGVVPLGSCMPHSLSQAGRTVNEMNRTAYRSWCFRGHWWCVISFSCALPFSTLGMSIAVSSLHVILRCVSACGRMTLFLVYALLLVA
jgi:hypothetical protein